MRGSGALVISALIGASVTFTFANGACTYSSTGQGGPAAALEPYDASGSYFGNGGDGDGSAGNGSGGFSGSSGGTSGSGDASPPIKNCGDCAGGICCGSTCCVGGTTCCADGNGCCQPPTTCPDGETACSDGVGCCTSGGVDAAPPPVQCGPQPADFAQYCLAYYGAVTQADACSSCLRQQAQTCAAKQPSCTIANCEQRCNVQLACPTGCATAAYCDCIYQCESPNGSNICCGPPTASLFMCAEGPCASECAADAGGDAATR